MKKNITIQGMNDVFPSTTKGKRRKLLILPIPLLILIQLTSCKKYLDERQSDAFTVPTTLTDLQRLLDEKATLNEAVSPSMPEASADDYFLTFADYNAVGQHSRTAPYTWDTDPFYKDNDWQKCYYPVYVANLSIEQSDKITRTNLNKEEWDNVRGTAHFLRAYYFLDLLWTYARAFDASSADTDPGIAIRLQSDINVKSTRASVNQSYKQVLSDAITAANYLPDVSIHPLRPSKAAAFGLLARTYLSMREYDSAYKYADKALQIYHELMDYNNDPDIIASFSTVNPPFKKYNKETIYYTSMNSVSPSYLPSYARIDTSLYSSYDNTDLRKSAFFKPVNNYYSFKGSYVSAPDIQFSGIATDELYLVRAECLARMGNKDGALADLNYLLLRRYKVGSFIPVTAADAQQALDKILIERRKELLMRGLRWMDLKRLNKEGANITLKRILNGQIFTLPPNDNRYAQPIPQEIIDITGMTQNPR